MRCDDIGELIEPWAAGESTPSAAEAAHLTSCAGCTRALSMARRLDRALATFTWAPARATLSHDVIRRISHDSWRREQRVDRAFNATLATGAAIVVAAAAYGLQLSGVFAIIGRAGAEAQQVVSGSFGVISMEPVLYAVATIVGVAALILWRWREGDQLV
jgi:hypothetical protein